MRRRSMTNRLLQFVVVLSVSTMFICLLLYAVNFPADERGPDYSWLKTRNMTAFLRPGDFSTTLIEPKHPFCRYGYLKKSNSSIVLILIYYSNRIILKQG